MAKSERLIWIDMIEVIVFRSHRSSKIFLRVYIVFLPDARLKALYCGRVSDS